jgi:D-glycero-D-manno-heptose 1,7-bisphosphate phosphatase
MTLVILDRDGVINQDSDDYIKTLDEWIPIPGSIEAIADLSRAGHSVVVATNQSGLGRGLFDLAALEAMHAALTDRVMDAGGQLQGIFYCPHTPDDNCSCRKPKPGLLDAIASELELSLADAYIVGDSLRDLQAGKARNCRLVLVRTGKGLATEKQLQTETSLPVREVQVYDSLASFTKILLEAE